MGRVWSSEWSGEGEEEVMVFRSEEGIVFGMRRGVCSWNGVRRAGLFNVVIFVIKGRRGDLWNGEMMDDL